MGRRFAFYFSVSENCPLSCPGHANNFFNLVSKYIENEPEPVLGGMAPVPVPL